MEAPRNIIDILGVQGRYDHAAVGGHEHVMILHQFVDLLDRQSARGDQSDGPVEMIPIEFGAERRHRLFERLPHRYQSVRDLSQFAAPTDENVSN